MPEINPYEAPQSTPAAEPREPDWEEPWPRWIGRLLGVQFIAIVMLMIASAISVVPEQQRTWNFILLSALVATGLLSIAVLVAAFRYRIGWLVALELIVIGLPLMMLFTVSLK